MKTIYFVRHGESQGNVDGLVVGSELESPLTKRGKEQARKAGLLLKDKKIELIISSPLERTRDTAVIIAKEIGYDPANITLNELFIERTAGPYSGLLHVDYQKDIRANTLKPGGESTEELYLRTKKAIDSLRDLKESRIVVVSHGGTGRMVRAIKHELPHHKAYTLPALDNAEIEEFTL